MKSKIIAVCFIMLLASCHRYDYIQTYHANTTRPSDIIILDRGYEIVNGSIYIDYKNGVGTFKIRKVQDE